MPPFEGAEQNVLWCAAPLLPPARHFRGIIAPMLARALVLIGTAVLPALAQAPQGGWKLVWSDEFDGPSIDRTKWDYDLGAGGWGNAEWENYTNRPENSRIENGNLIIEARRDFYAGIEYSSARMVTRGKFSRTYGRFEARIKIPYGQGIWPAFWMLGDDISTVGWPRCGEIDIMEVIGREPYTVYGTAHMPQVSNPSQPISNGGATYKMTGAQIHEDFHIFAIEWGPEEIKWYFDENLYKTWRKSETPENGVWVFNKPFHMLLNVAVGGRWPGNPDSTTTFPQQMLVDYVRVYERAQPALAPERAVVNGASFQPGIGAGAWATIAGTDLAGSTREWTAADFKDGVAPTVLDDTEVLIGGKPAYIGYISPTQLNVVAPDAGAGQVQVEVIRGGVHSNTVTAELSALSPAFFLWQGKYTVAHRHPNWDPVAPAGLFPGLATSPAKPGDIVILWGTGFGPTTPPTTPGQLPQAGAAVAAPVTVRVGGQTAEVVSAVVSAYVGVYQIAIKVPAGLPAGEQAVTAEAGGAATPQPAVLAVAN